MAALDEEARRKIELPTLLADAFVGIEIAETNVRKKNDRLNGLSAMAERFANGDVRGVGMMRFEALEDLAKDEPNGSPRQPFHWPLEFPEVFSRADGGFDAFVGNPPFLGGKRIREAIGSAFRDWLVGAIAEGTRGSADLVAYFFLQTFRLLREHGSIGFLAVNTISEGDTRQVGLERMLKAGGEIYAAYPNEIWPGSANVVTSRIHITLGRWTGIRVLSDKGVPFISAFLTDRREWTPKPLRTNRGIAFIGSFVSGEGFILEPSAAEGMIERDLKNKEVLFPYINGQDLNADPQQKPSRWCINFWDWPLDRARQYKQPFKVVEERVFPVRKNNNRAKYRERWWHFAEAVPNCYHAIGRGDVFDRHPADWKKENYPLLNPVFVAVQTGKYLSISHQPNDIIFSHMTVVFANNEPALFAQLNSTFHYNWVQQYSATLETRLRYIPTDCFENFPLARATDDLSHIGCKYNDSRSKMMQDLGLGLTKAMNAFHEESRSENSIARFREFQIQTDQAVLDAYGWNDLRLDHDFRAVEYLPENDNVRFTISDELRREVLHRLALLNKERWLAEGNEDDGY
jgi:hypothetical protein